MVRIRRRCPRRARGFLAPGSSTRTIATTRAKGGKSQEVRMGAMVADAAAWAADIPAVVTAATAGGGGKKREKGRKVRKTSRPPKRTHPPTPAPHHHQAN